MVNCPSAVTGAMTSVRSVDGGVVVDVTAPDHDGKHAILQRARKHATMGAPDPARGLHTGEHGGPGTTGHCPIIHVGTTVDVVEIAGGARITVMAVDPADAGALQRDTRERVQWYTPTAAR